jgi:hypothetical protein
MSHPAGYLVILDRNSHIGNLFDKDEYVQHISPLRQPKTDSKTSSWIIPVKGTLVAHNETRTALQATLISKINSILVGVPLIAFGGTYEGACPVGAPLTNVPVHPYMGFIVDVVAH